MNVLVVLRINIYILIDGVQVLVVYVAELEIRDVAYAKEKGLYHVIINLIGDCLCCIVTGIFIILRSYIQ